MTHVDLDNLFQDIGNLDDGAIIKQGKGVVMNENTFYKIVGTQKMNVEYGKKYKIYLIIEEIAPEQVKKEGI